MIKDMNTVTNVPFAHLYIVGLAEAEDIHDYINTWHNSPEDGQELHEFLGLTDEEYGEWVRDEGTLRRLRRTA